jgi:hypothetical protein
MSQTVKVRMPVLMFSDGEWTSLAAGSRYQEFHATQAREVAKGKGQLYWLTAELPVPEPVPEVEAEVES